MHFYTIESCLDAPPTQQAFLNPKNKGKIIAWLFQEEKYLEEISSFYNQIDST